MSEPMNSIGVFREREIDGEPYHIYKFLSQTDSFSDPPTIDSGVEDFHPLFICQSFRKSFEWKTKRMDDNFHHYLNKLSRDQQLTEDFLPVDDYPHFFNKRCGDQQFEFPIGSKIYDHKCKLPLVPLFWCNNKELNSSTFCCGVCESLKPGTSYYFCVTCGEKFHKECIESPLEIKHPTYPFLSLKLYYSPGNLSNLNSIMGVNCFYCQETISEMLYYSPTYKLALDPVCTMKPIPILIDHPKRHPHLLTFFPKQNSLACNVCGLIKELIPTYVCARCVFVVHQDCIYSPYVIKISRHQHRISFTYSIPSGKWFCGVCRRKVDNNYGAYTCNKCDDYFVHTRCALREDIWDGEELEGIPEEPEIIVEPFERISDGVILHFSHDHHLKLVMSGVYDEGKICEACILPIYEGNYYSCMNQCHFILHEACANAPCKKQHALNAHSLTLKVLTSDYVTNEYWSDQGYFNCRACLRKSCGFVYEDTMGGYSGFKLDLRCASISEPFIYEGHEHPLYLALTPEEEGPAMCQICSEDSVGYIYSRKLTCIECKYVVCFACATLPYKARYKHDKHFLTFKKEKEASDHPGWCEACENQIVFSRKGGFYSCDDYCSTTVHVDCLLGGKDMYMKPGQTITMSYKEFLILRNNTMSRPFCHGKEHRCHGKVVFKKENMTFCSKSCFDDFTE